MLATKLTLDEFDILLQKLNLVRFMRICSWIKRFINNCRRAQKTEGPLTTQEINDLLSVFIKREQQRYKDSTEFEKDRQILNIETDKSQILICKGRIQRSYPIYLPTDSLLSSKIAESAHSKTMHGGSNSDHDRN